MSQGSQYRRGLFHRFQKGSALALCNLHHDLNIVYDILETIEGRNGIRFHKPKTDTGVGWAVDGGDHAEDGTQTDFSNLPRPFGITVLTASSITVTALCFMRGAILTEQSGDLTASLSGKLQYVCADVDTVTHAVTLSVSDDPASVFPYSAVQDSKTYKIPLYVLTRATTEGDGSNWCVQLDYRFCPVVLYT